MLSEIEKSTKYFKSQFGSMDKVPPGIYAVPYTTAVSDSFLRVKVGEDQSLSDFSLWMDKDFKEGWEETVQKYIPKNFNI